MYRHAEHLLGNNPDGSPFTNSFGFHFNARAENYLEIGWRTGDAILDSGFTGSEIVPEPHAGFLLIIGGLMLLIGTRYRVRARLSAVPVRNR